MFEKASEITIKRTKYRIEFGPGTKVYDLGHAISKLPIDSEVDEVSDSEDDGGTIWTTITFHHEERVDED